MSRQPAVPAFQSSPAVSIPAATRRQHETWLKQITGLPTVAGREDAVIDAVTQWCATRDDIVLTHDKHGNLLLKRKGARSQKPIFFTAHLDHPAFMVTACQGTQLKAEFRGGVHASYFVGSKVRVYPNNTAKRSQSVTGTIDSYAKPGEANNPGASHWASQVTVTLDKACAAQAGDVMTWDLAEPVITDGRLHTPACDDLAAVAAALAAFDVYRNTAANIEETGQKLPDVRVLFTRAEEIGFIGAIGAAKDKTIPQHSRLICLENSKSFIESPIGGGPIVRVGDKTATFTSELTYSVGRVAMRLHDTDNTFSWQRKLMAGGTCEATAFHSLGYTATCVCLPLGNYHNMNEETGTIQSETIALADYHALIRLLVACGLWLDVVEKEQPLSKRMQQLFAQRSSVL